MVLPGRPESRNPGARRTPEDSPRQRSRDPPGTRPPVLPPPAGGFNGDPRHANRGTCREELRSVRRAAAGERAAGGTAGPPVEQELLPVGPHPPPVQRKKTPAGE